MGVITKGALMNLRSKRTVAAAVAVAVLAGGAGVAIAASHGGGDPGEDRAAVLEDVACELAANREAFYRLVQAVRTSG